MSETQSHFAPLFANAFGFNNFGESSRELNKQLVEDIEKERSENEGKNKTFRKNPCGWQSVAGIESKYESFQKLGEKIIKAFIPIVHSSGIHPEEYKKFTLGQFWANVIFAAGGFSNPHIHGNGITLWTGVYYPKGLEEVDDLDDFDSKKYFQYTVNKTPGSLVLKDPSGTAKRQVKSGLVDQRYYSTNFSVVPRESLLVLFPAYMEHYVTPTIDNSKRYSISFAFQRTLPPIQQ